MGCEIGNEKGWRDVLVGVATGTETAWDCQLKCRRDRVIQIS
jgi:hypothetical protein